MIIIKDKLNIIFQYKLLKIYNNNTQIYKKKEILKTNILAVIVIKCYKESWCLIL